MEKHCICALASLDLASSAFPATRPRWPGSPTYSWGPRITSGYFRVPRTSSALQRFRLCLTSALQGPGHGLIAGRNGQLKAGGTGNHPHPPAGLTALLGPFFLNTLTGDSALTGCTFTMALSLGHLVLFGLWQEPETGWLQFPLYMAVGGRGGTEKGWGHWTQGPEAAVVDGHR